MPAIPSEEEWLGQTAKAREEAEERDAMEESLQDTPVHPILQLQGPFEESIFESTGNLHSNWQVEIDAQARRNQILTAPTYERLCGRRWRQRPNEKYHPLWKIIAQVAFGLHLLAKDLAMSEAAVIKILQVHVAEMDIFIENTTDDLFLAFSDIVERLDNLRLPLGNLPIFNDMLMDPAFRQTVIQDHERIEHIIQRTAMGMDDAVKDIAKGKQSVRILGYYLKALRAECNDQPQGFGAVYDAMIGNVDGWKREFRLIKRKAYDLASNLGALNQVALEIQQLVRAATLSGMQSMVPSRPGSSASRLHNPREHIKHTLDADRASIISNKPLPRSPIPVETSPYTAEARAVSIVTGRSPATLIKTNTSRQDSHTPHRSVPDGRRQQNNRLTNDKEPNNNANRFYSNAQTKSTSTLRRSVTAPDSSTNNSIPPVKAEQNSKKRHKSNTSKDKAQHSGSEKDSMRSFAKFGSKFDRFQKTTTKIFNVSAFANSKASANAAKASAKAASQAPQASFPKLNETATIQPAEKLDPMEQSWIDFNTPEPQMSWSYQSKKPSIQIQKPQLLRKDNVPEFPHLLFMSFLDDQTLSDEEDDAFLQENQTEEKQDIDSQVTALPIFSNSDQQNGVGAEVASSYSSINAGSKAKSILPPLTKPKLNSASELDASNGHVIYQKRQRLRSKSSILSFISSKRAPEATSNSPLVRSREDSSRSEQQQQKQKPRTPPSVYEEASPAPVLNSTWQAPKEILARNIETPPISPKTSPAPLISAVSETREVGSMAETIHSSSRGSIADVKPRQPSSLSRSYTSGSDNTLSSPAGVKKPHHGSLSLFPRTPTTPNMPRKLVSMTSLRDVTVRENGSNNLAAPKSRG